MIARFLFLWIIGTLVSFFWLYVSTKGEKALGKFMLKAVTISGIISGIFIFIAMIVNNFSGI